MPNPESARRSPLAERLFQVEGVTGVFLGGDFITVTKACRQGSGSFGNRPCLGIIMEHFIADRPVLSEAVAATEEAAEDDEIVPANQGVDSTRACARRWPRRRRHRLPRLRARDRIMSISRAPAPAVRVRRLPWRMGIENMPKHLRPGSDGGARRSVARTLPRPMGVAGKGLGIDTERDGMTRGRRRHDQDHQRRCA